MLKGEKTRERIVSKAAQLFNERGLEGTSLADLMEATGLEKGGIYRHFPSKEAVAVEAFEYAWQSEFAARIHDLDTISNSVLGRPVGSAAKADASREHLDHHERVRWAPNGLFWTRVENLNSS